jgi:hypothetical protein
MLLCHSYAADKKQLADAVAAVDANLKTTAGKQYDETIGNEFPARFQSSVKQCKQSLPAGSTASPFDMLLKLDARGKVQEVLVDPETALALCTRTALLAGSFSPPPRGDYWINIHMQFKR